MRFTCLILLLPLWAGADVLAESSSQVSREVLVEAMRTQQGYDPKVTPNGGRFQAGVFLHLVKRAIADGGDEGVLSISYEDWYRAFLHTQGLAEEAAPLFVRLAYQNFQNTDIDFRRPKVLRTPDEHPEILTAANVIIWWDKRSNAKRSYSYDDTLSTPNLKVTNHRVITYRLLDFGERIAFDALSGVTGRPTTGLLGFLFRLIGDGRLIWSQFAISSDGLQIVRARSKKGFLGVTSTVTVQPDGKGEKDIPEGRRDLSRIETMLKQEIDVRYTPLDLGGK